MCTGNVHRSQLAAGLMARNAHDAGLTVEVSSGATECFDEPIDPAVLAILDRRGVKLTRTVSQPIDEELTRGAHLILTMTADHATKVIGRFPNRRSKVFVLEHLVKSAAPRRNDESAAAWLQRVLALPRDYSHVDRWDIIDPFGAPPAVLDQVAGQIDLATGRLCAMIART